MLTQMDIQILAYMAGDADAYQLEVKARPRCSELARTRKEIPAMLALRQRSRGALNGRRVSTEVNALEACLNEQEATCAANNSRECRLPAVPEAKVKEKKRLPESFDELAAALHQKFGRLAADVEQMAKELREADIHAEQLRHRLLGGRTF